MSEERKTPEIMDETEQTAVVVVGQRAYRIPLEAQEELRLCQQDAISLHGKLAEAEEMIVTKFSSPCIAGGCQKAALQSAHDKALADLAEAKTHIGREPPSMERIRTAHSLLATDRWREDHRSYNQDHTGGESCYICTLHLLLIKGNERDERLQAGFIKQEEAYRNLAADRDKVLARVRELQDGQDG